MAAHMSRAPREAFAVALVSAAILAATAQSQEPARLLSPPARQNSPAVIQPARETPSLLPVGHHTSPIAATAAREQPAVFTADSRSGLKVSKGAGILPNDQGQVWREYDISPYTTRVRDVARPEQAIVDWILRETGTEVWFAEPLGVLSATSTTLRVYHTPEMHERIRAIVERFVGGDGEEHALGVRLMTVGSPNWRSRALPLLKPVDVKSPGVEAWLLSRENTAILHEQLKSRADFREHSSPHVEIANGQSQTLARTNQRQYSRGVQLKREFPFYDVIPGKIDEGYSLQISPLMSLDGQTMEAAITCSVDQVEKLVPLAVDVPTGNQSQRVQIQVPQVASWRLSERFRWPTKDVLLLSCGVVASPAPATGGVLSVLSPLGVTSGNRCDALLMIEHRSPIAAAMATAPPVNPPSPVVPPIAKPAVTGAASSVSRGRY